MISQNVEEEPRAFFVLCSLLKFVMPKEAIYGWLADSQNVDRYAWSVMLDEFRYLLNADPINDLDRG